MPMKGIVSAKDSAAIWREDMSVKTATIPGYEHFTAQEFRDGNPGQPIIVNPDGSTQDFKQWAKAASVVKPRYVLLPHWDPELAAEILHDHADDMGNPHQRLAAPAPADYPGLVDLAKQGGFTLHDHVGDGPTSGYMVSRDKNTETSMPIESLQPKMIGDFVNKNSRTLSQPGNYLGGWLDGKNFYLDVSTHRPTIDRASADAVKGSQLAIYDLNHDTAINTPDAVWQSGDPGLAVPENHHQNPFYGALQVPEHDWLQHGLGDDEHWEVQNRIQAALNPDGSFDLGGLQDTGTHVGTHKGTTIFTDPAKKENWLVKPTPKGSEFLADGDVAASQISHDSGLDAPPTFKVQHPNGQPASAQLMYPGATDAFPKVLNPKQIDSMSDDDLLTVQKHHALDWLLGNHDAHGGQFIRGGDGKLIGIDKAQAFKYFNNDKLDWNYHPNGAMYGEDEPIHSQIYRHFAKGGRIPFDPREGELGKYVAGLQGMPDDKYAETIRPYAEGAKASGQLAKDFYGGYEGQAPAKFKPNNVEAFIQAAIARKNSLMADLGHLYDRAKTYRMTGTKIAKKKVAAPPDPLALKYMHQQLGSHGSKVYADPQGKWLIKSPPPGADFMPPLDQATHDLQKNVGLTAPETHVISLHGQPVTAVKMLEGASQAFDEPPDLASVHPADRMTLQKHHVLDWLIGNHDAHAGNFMRMPSENPGDPSKPGELVGIDKGQALKYFGRDKLDPSFRPNFYARPPIMNHLLGQYAAGHPGEVDDPRTGELGEFTSRLQGIPDEELKHMFRPYAETAAKAGMLADIKDDDPRRKLGPATIPPNDPESFLDALAHRKNTLMKTLGDYFDKLHQRRHFALEQQGGQ